jgi:hypothetical protein
VNSRSFPLSGRRRLRRVAIAGAAASALALGVSALPFLIPVAQATPVPNGCIGHSGDLCTWQNSNYSGTQWNFTPSVLTDGYWWTVGDAANDQISSLYDYNSSYVFVAKNCPADSEWTWIGTADGAPNLADNKWPDGTGMNDSISAYGIGTPGEPHPNFPDHGSRMLGGC